MGKLSKLVLNERFSRRHSSINLKGMTKTGTNYVPENTGMDTDQQLHYKQLIADKEAAALKKQAAKEKRDAKKLETSAKEKQEKEEFDKMVDENKKRETDYINDMKKEKEHEKIQDKIEEPKRSSGLIDTAVRSIRF